MMPAEAVFEAFYHYGYDGKEMIAVRAPFALSAGADEIIGQRARIDGCHYRILSMKRQIHGPVPAGEPIGLEVRLDPVVPGDRS